MPRAATLIAFAASLVLAAVPGPAMASGSPTAKPSVVGGAPASLPEWGFTVAILNKGRNVCSGSVIAPTRVLTAAHCLLRSNPADLAILANSPRVGSPGGEIVGVSGFAIAPGYLGAGPHDLAVIHLASATTAPVISLPTAEEDALLTPVGSLLTVGGFGRSNPLKGVRRTGGGVLRTTTVLVRKTCALFYARRIFTTATNICAQGSRIGKTVIRRTSCFGDSGGPLVASTATTPRVVGVTSGALVTTGRFRRVLCGFDKNPAVSVRVAAELPFIQANMP